MDDEAFARMLQQQMLEEAGMNDGNSYSNPAPYGGDGVHRSAPQYDQQPSSQFSHYDSSPHYNSAPQYNSSPQYNSQHGSSPQYNSSQYNSSQYNSQYDNYGTERELASRMAHMDVQPSPYDYGAPQPRQPVPAPHHRNPPQGQQRSQAVDDQLAYARRLQEQALMQNSYGQPPTSRNPDLEFARRMQEQGQMGAGRKLQNPGNSQIPGPGSGMTAQEEEDARLAMLMHESGESLRNIDEGGGGGGYRHRPQAQPQPQPQPLRQRGASQDGPLQGMPPQSSPHVMPPQSSPHVMPPQSSPHVVPPQRSPHGMPPPGGPPHGTPQGNRAPPIPPSSGQGPPYGGAASGYPDQRPRQPAPRSRPDRSPPPFTQPHPASSRSQAEPNLSRGESAGPPSRGPGVGASPEIRRGESAGGAFARGAKSPQPAMAPPAAIAPPGGTHAPPGVNVPGDDVFLDRKPAAQPAKAPKKKGFGRIFGRNKESKEERAMREERNKEDRRKAEQRQREERASREDWGRAEPVARRPGAQPEAGDKRIARIPAPIPPPPGRRPNNRPGPLPHSLSVSRDLSIPLAQDVAVQKRKMLSRATCAVCKRSNGQFIVALEKKYHTECFKCVACHELIDATGPFAFTESGGEKQPLHRRCYAELYGIKCAVCKQSIPAGPDGKISFVKHPFFDTEQMCPRHATNPGRRCTGCHRFEPEDIPFADLGDADRCVCFSCCRSVVVDPADAQPLYAKVIDFFENKLNLPIWPDLREVPVLVVGYDALNDQLARDEYTAHAGSSQIMTRGLCLTEHESGRKFKLAKLKFNKNNFSFEACDVEAKGFTYFQVPDASKVNPDASVTAILCLSGLPKDLASSILAHEATHAWIKLHPRFDISMPIPAMVEEGVAQLVAMLFLTDGLDPPSTASDDDVGPSDEKLRQYFKFSIETDDNEIYGAGYRQAAIAYSNIGIEALMSHVVLYQDFPQT